MNPILKTLADNQLLLEAVKDLLLAEFDVKWLEVSPDSDDVVLGQQMRARLVGMNKVLDVIRRIEKLKTIPASPEKFNQAR